MRKLLVVAAISLALFSLACKGADRHDNDNHDSNARGNANVGNEARGGMSDGWITMKTKLALLANHPTSGFETDVDTRDGLVTLTGIVDTNEAKAAADEVVKKIEGVRGVNNKLQVVPEAKRKEVNATDDKIKEEIGKALDNDPKLKDLSLAVDSDAGVVSLDGTVDTNEQLLYAAQAIRKISGVKSVITSAVTVANDKNS
ncbi:MAG TPA: BON domain-containing protein [Blastocatellia bacterium]